jgi:hypothetical protein
VAWNAVFVGFLFLLLPFGIMMLPVPNLQILAVGAFSWFACFVWALFRPHDWFPAILFLAFSLGGWIPFFVQLFLWFNAPRP